MADGPGDAHVTDERLSQHYLDQLDHAESDAIHSHLKGCESCRRRADDVIEVLGALALLIDEPGPTP
jgi:predicted anti-sigma-YlaC factor YlaD